MKNIKTMKHFLWMLAAIYNLQGQQLDAVQHGVNIVGGRKIFTKKK